MRAEQRAFQARLLELQRQPTSPQDERSEAEPTETSSDSASASEGQPEPTITDEGIAP